jgi:hypothetical protein
MLTGHGSNVAVQCDAAMAAKVPPQPESPDHPANRQPGSGSAVKETDTPGVTKPAHVVVQVLAGPPLTIPPPLTAMTTGIAGGRVELYRMDAAMVVSEFEVVAQPAVMSTARLWSVPSGAEAYSQTVKVEGFEQAACSRPKSMDGGMMLPNRGTV